MGFSCAHILPASRPWAWGFPSSAKFCRFPGNSGPKPMELGGVAAAGCPESARPGTRFRGEPGGGLDVFLVARGGRTSASVSCPRGTCENSPTFQRWVRPRHRISPEGTADKAAGTSDFSRPFGTHASAWPNPTLKRWAIFKCPSGTRRRSPPPKRIGKRRFPVGWHVLVVGRVVHVLTGFGGTVPMGDLVVGFGGHARPDRARESIRTWLIPACRINAAFRPGSPRVEPRRALDKSRR